MNLSPSAAFMIYSAKTRAHIYGAERRRHTQIPTSANQQRKTRDACHESTIKLANALLQKSLLTVLRRRFRGYRFEDKRNSELFRLSYCGFVLIAAN